DRWARQPPRWIVHIAGDVDRFSSNRRRLLLLEDLRQLVRHLVEALNVEAPIEGARLPERGACAGLVTFDELDDPLPHQRVDALPGRGSGAAVEGHAEQGGRPVRVIGGELHSRGVYELGRA